MSTSSSYAAKRVARLVAVQILYQASYEEEALADLLKQAAEAPFALLNDEGADEETAIREKPDMELVRAIVLGVTEHRPALQEMLAGALGEGKSPERLETLLKTILLCGVFELYHHADIDTGILISDYVDVTHAFFQGKESGLVNAILDKLAKTLRT